MKFKAYLKEEKKLDFITEQLSKEEEKDIIDAGHNIAKEIFGKDFDEKKAKKLIDDIIKKYGKKNDIDSIIEILTNSFQKA